MQTWPRPPSASRGVTVLEVLTVVAVLAILAGATVPVMGMLVEDARIERAESEIDAIGAALATFQATLDEWPTRDAAGRPESLWILLSGAVLPVRNPWAAAHDFWTWTRGGRGDLLDHHLYQNRPGGQTGAVYPSLGKRMWRGPYLDPAGLDPWGRPYVVNVVSSWSRDPRRYRRVWVLSAGPDGRFQTSSRARLSDGIRGDDIGAVIHQR